MNLDLNQATFPRLLRVNAEKHGERKAALRRKGRGIWQEISWKRYEEDVRTLALGLMALGFSSGDRLAIISGNRPESLIAELAAQSAGGISLGLYQDSTAKEVEDALRRFQVSFVVAEDQEQVDKLLEAGQETARALRIIHIEQRGLRKYRDGRLSSLRDVMNHGREQSAALSVQLDKLISQGKADDIAVICLTSGTSSAPKGAMLSHRNLLAMADAFNQVSPRRDSDEFVSLLPLAWFGEQMMSVASALVSGFTVNFPEKPETAMADLREIGPHVMLSPPKVWESIATSVRNRMMESTPFKKFMYDSCMPIGRKMAEYRLSGKPAPSLLKLQNQIAHICLFRPLRDRLGLSRVREALTGGAPLDADIFSFFHAIGVDLKQMYGQTELAGVSCAHRADGINGSTVGSPLPGTEIRIDDNGEILTRGPGVFSGYFNDEEATRNVFKDGWLRSGDVGKLGSDGQLTVKDRVDNLLRMANGEILTAQRIESGLTSSPYISHAMALDNGNPHVSVLISINGGIVGKWAGDNKINYTTYADLASRPEVISLIEKEIASANEALPETAKIRRFAILYKELDADEGELTRTGKVRKFMINRLYGDVIDSIKAGRDSCDIDTNITFPDGKSSRIQTTVAIRKL